MVLEIVYCIMTYLAIVALSGAFGNWAVANGIEGPESKAKRLAITWRLAEAVVAALEVYVLWRYLEFGGASFVVAVVFSLIVGGMYGGGSLFSAITVPMGDQMSYFRAIRSKSRSAS